MVDRRSTWWSAMMERRRSDLMAFRGSPLANDLGGSPWQPDALSGAEIFHPRDRRRVWRGTAHAARHRWPRRGLQPQRRPAGTELPRDGNRLLVAWLLGQARVCR